MSGNSEKPLRGRTAIVTGSGQNIGKAIALALAAAGANVTINGLRDREKIDAVANEARALGVGALAVLADVGDPGAVASMVAATVREFGSADIAVSNVAIRPHQPFLEITADDWQRVVNTNLNAAFYLAHAVLSHMVQRRWGRLIHISGRDGFMPKANRAHNVTCKAALHGLAKAIAVEFGPHGITANTVAPGPTVTERDLSNYPDYQAMEKEWIAAMPLRRMATVEDIAAACAYLASDAAGYITGQLLHLNGGMLMS